MGVLLISLIGCGALPHDGSGRRKHQRHTVTCLFQTKYFCPRQYTGEIPHFLCFGRKVNPRLRMMRELSPRTPHAIAVSATSRRCCATSVCNACIHDSRPGCTFYSACANIDGLHPLASYQRAQDCVFYACVSDTFTAMLRSGLSSSSTRLSS